MSGDRFRELALGLEGAVEGSHMGHADFRAAKAGASTAKARAATRIFATLTDDEETGGLKLTPEQQAQLLARHGPTGPFAAASGAWGKAGFTMVRLAQAAEGDVAAALRRAWENVRT